jgi:predicted transcriptional regulator
LQDKEEYIQHLTDVENADYERRKELAEQEYQEDLDRLERRYTDQAIYAEAQKMLANETLDSITAKYIEFEERFGEVMSYIGDQIEDEFIAKIRRAIEYVEELNAMKIEVKSPDTSSIPSNASGTNNFEGGLTTINEKGYLNMAC